jgi:flagellar export protein FliJ
LVVVARVEMLKARAEYLEAHRELKVVARLEEKARSIHRVETLRSEQSELDELAGQRRVQPFSVSL